ncbi:glycyl-tRNA synthetase [Coprinopsis cinerea AmutBmut pab1-1]|nr:glycyl-tRNA synthetase [Coprinopsis cinerea AmutBmut pab1-1]
MSTAVNKSAHPFDKAKFETLLNRRFFYAPAFEIYGGVAGLYDYGPSGSALQANIISEWRKHFVVHDGMFELDTTILTPAAVLETSGHVAQFTDWVVKDAKSGAVLRAKDLIKEVLETRLADPVNFREGFPFNKAFLKLGGKDGSADTARGLDDNMAQEYEGVLRELDSYGEQELADILKKHRIRNPDTDNAVGSPEPFDLMFKTSIGSTGQQRVYLRPETAQGQFLHFNRLLELNNGRLPFASALVGRVFHNEISPRGGLLRVREFTAAEIEHYMDPDDKSHPGFMEVKNVQIAVLDRHMQEVGLQEAKRPSVGEAVCSGLVANEALGYFMARIWQFLVNIGIDSDRLRFRQRMGSNTAHYAVDNWDVEIHNSVTGWILCGGCADRAAYDLDLHSAKTGTPLVARQGWLEKYFTLP